MFTWGNKEKTKNEILAYFQENMEISSSAKYSFLEQTELVPDEILNEYQKIIRDCGFAPMQIEKSQKDGIWVVRYAIYYKNTDIAAQDSNYSRMISSLNALFSKYSHINPEFKRDYQMQWSAEIARRWKTLEPLFRFRKYFCFCNDDIPFLNKILSPILNDLSFVECKTISGAWSYIIVEENRFSKKYISHSIKVALVENRMPFIEIVDNYATFKAEIQIPQESVYLQDYRPDLGIKVRSSWEANVFRVLKFKQIPFEYERELYSFSDFAYLPDFFLPENVIIEVKGFWDSESRKKIFSLQKEHPEFKILPVDRDMYESLQNRFSPVIPNWEEFRAYGHEKETVTIVGMRFCADKRTISHLKKEDILAFKREPNNEFDRNAILVITEDGSPIGHLSGDWAAVYAPKMDCGMEYTATIFDVQPKVITAKMWRSNPDKEAFYECFK